MMVPLSILGTLCWQTLRVEAPLQVDWKIPWRWYSYTISFPLSSLGRFCLSGRTQKGWQQYWSASACEQRSMFLYLCWEKCSNPRCVQLCQTPSTHQTWQSQLPPSRWHAFAPWLRPAYTKIQIQLRWWQMNQQDRKFPLWCHNVYSIIQSRSRNVTLKTSMPQTDNNIKSLSNYSFILIKSVLKWKKKNSYIYKFLPP